MSLDEQFMSRCIQLAKLGRGNVAPNPMVGAVIAHEGKIIGEGYHQRFGEAHAEVNAVKSVKDLDLLSESTIYVSLEPCAHHGKTPPCADLLVEKKFKRVVIGCRDAHSKVDGKGIQRMLDANIEVTIGVLEDECRKLNAHFFTFHQKKRPYVLLKWAETSNGLIDQNGVAGSSPRRTVTWISVPEVQTLVHKWRAEYQAILVGRKTVENDNPSLTVRAVKGNNPTRIVLDSKNVLSKDSAVFNDEAETIVLNTERDTKEGHINYVQIEDISPATILSALYEKNIQSVLIEGGRKTLQSFIDVGLWDEAKVIIGQQTFDNGTKAPELNKQPQTSEEFFGDLIHTYVNL
ncbi:MAG: bifunctional diaminohydroxyphosphoribosylaminopyrimidine deaminase/5-amino-6-(5-phosphoribosylamino)uracil reductase RibD [Crocinitomicaceae bacterium]|nr:bifunctional diaminohydroxyphosphoribosylaminopyrimidine deaminase/5-amino-6-(5-phosphoribosylamino)uracil reductase RibD [Crocinitomicaceae bacterium]